MGLLDPKLDKERTFELLRKKGATKATLEFHGGHDEGDVESIVLAYEDGSDSDLEVWYCGGYGIEDDGKGGYQYVPMSTPQNEDQELSDLLQGPVNQRFGAWGGVDSTNGVLVWDAKAGTVKMTYSQDEPVEHDLEW